MKKVIFSQLFLYISMDVSRFLLMIITEEVRHLLHRLFQDFNPRQIYHPEMIRLLPVESASMDEKNFFILQKIQCKLFIIGDIELFHIDLWKNIEGRLWFHCTDAGDIRQCFINIISLLPDSSARNHIALHALVSAQGRLYN